MKNIFFIKNEILNMSEVFLYINDKFNILYTPGSTLLKKFVMVYYTANINSFTLLILLFCFIISLIPSYNFKVWNGFTLNINKNFIFFLFAFNIWLIMIKLIFTANLNDWIMYFYFFQQNKAWSLSYLSLVPSCQTGLVGDSLLILCYIVSIVTFWYLGDKGLNKSGSSIGYSIFFLICVTIMVTTNSLIVLLLSFEFIFLPSLFFVYKFSYTKKSDKTILYLLAWTFFGSLIILMTTAYLVSITKSYYLNTIASTNLSTFEKELIYFMFFLGFSVKLPIFPFYFWLIKVHVEAPAGFSMFLSGFLVKTAFYCFFVIDIIITSNITKWLCLILIIFSCLDASIKMWTQADLKKLIAFATIQEMNLMMLFLLLFKGLNPTILGIFILMHGVLSTLMFFIVDQIQKRTQSRSIFNVTGILNNYPILKLLVYFMLANFLGLPFTTKFLIEIHCGILFWSFFKEAGILIFMFIILFGSIGFAKSWFLVLFGSANTNKNIEDTKIDLNKHEFYIGFFLSSILFLLQFLLFFY